MVFGVLFVWTPLSYAEMGYGLLAYWKRVLVGIIVLNCRGEKGGRGGGGGGGVAVSLFIMWTVWRKHSQLIFERVESSLLEIKSLYVHSLYDWMAALSGHSFSSCM